MSAEAIHTPLGPRPRLLLVEDEASLVMTLTDRLRSEGYEVDAATDGPSGLERATEGSYDLIVLDVMLPGQNGLDVCRDLRQRGVPTPVLMLTARGQVIDKVVALKLGADDYLTKPFDTMELLARVEALLRRARAPVSVGAGRFVFGDVTIDFARSEVLRDGQEITLSALEYKLLAHFVEHRGRVLSRDQLLDEVWGYDAMPFTRTVDVHVAALRQKLEPQPAKPRFILTVRGRGYKFVA